MDKKVKTVKGKSIKRINTLSSMYDNGSTIELSGNGKTYRMNVGEFLKVIKDSEFEVEQKVKYAWLTIK